MAPDPQTSATHTHSGGHFPFSLRPTPCNVRNTMASASPEVATTKQSMDISNLMSPPEPPKLESFARITSIGKANSVNVMSVSTGSIACDARCPIASVSHPLSPPISPSTPADKHVVKDSSASTKDPILYPHEASHFFGTQPLFSAEETPDVRRIVKSHIAARPMELFRSVSPPRQEDYELMLHLTPQIMKAYQRDPRAWLQRERDQLRADNRAQKQHVRSKLPHILPATKPQPIRKEPQRAKPAAKAPKIIKIKSTTVTQAMTTTPRPIRAGPGPTPAAPRPSRPAARAPSSTPDPSSRRGTTQNRADDDFNSIQDICPPLQTLDSKTGVMNNLQADWKINPASCPDLSNDPHRHLLHPEELVLASTLRLTGAVYLTSKRRIFVARSQGYQRGRDVFRKTDAQQACRIDVNKASKLWTAFDKVGWLDKAWVLSS
ncbi:SWIRM domain-containing protein [Astrocystis sublimbata]|nr:SWIRM domain-containing protein [Astrocystis sublimbata]